MSQQRAIGPRAGLRHRGRGVVKRADAVEVPTGEGGKFGVHLGGSARAGGNGLTLAGSRRRAQDLWVAIAFKFLRSAPSI